MPPATNRHFTLLPEMLQHLHVHTWSRQCQVAIKLAPDRKKFMEIISGSGDINKDIEKFCSTFSPLLAENHKFLVSSVQIIVFVANTTILWRRQFYYMPVYLQASVGMDDLKASWCSTLVYHSACSVPRLRINKHHSFWNLYYTCYV